MANGPLNKRALDLLWAMYQKVEGDIEQEVLPEEVARETNIIDPSWYYYREIYAATMNYLVERKEALVFVDEPFPKSRDDNYCARRAIRLRDSPGPIACRLDIEGDKKLRIPFPRCLYCIVPVLHLRPKASGLIKRGRKG